MESFVLVLKNQRIRWFNRLGLLIILINGLYFGFYLLKNISEENYFFLAGGILVTIAGIIFNFKSSINNKGPRVPFSILFILVVIVWLALHIYWLSAAMLLLAFFDFIARKKQSVLFFNERIELPSFPKKKISWHDLNNAILKDRVLTLDFKNNRLIQSEIAEESFGIEENIFNSFCDFQLKNNN